MFVFRTLAFVCCVVVAGCLGSANVHAAEPSKKPESPASCHGDDMLAELAEKAPDLFQKVQTESRALGNTEAVLWKIEKPGVGTSYLFGTMHLSDRRLTELSPAVVSAIKSSKTLALEVADLSEKALAEGMSKATDLLMYSGGKNLQSQLTAEEYKIVQQVVAKSGMPGEFAGMLKPWLVNMLLALSDCERQKVASGAAVLDMKIAEEAQKNKIAVVGLESIEQQLSALASVPEDQQLQMLKVGLKYADRADDMMETLVQMYLKRELGAAMPFQIALASQHGVSANAFEGFKTSLLVERNVRMRDAAKSLLDKGEVFIAVGALHLPGPTGLVALFREAGFTVAAFE